MHKSNTDSYSGFEKKRKRKYTTVQKFGPIVLIALSFKCFFRIQYNDGQSSRPIKDKQVR